MHIIHMGVTLAELCLLGKNTQHSQVGYIGHRCGRFILIASLESLNYKTYQSISPAKVREKPPKILFNLKKVKSFLIVRWEKKQDIGENAHKIVTFTLDARGPLARQGRGASERVVLFSRRLAQFCVPQRGKNLWHTGYVTLGCKL